MEQTSAVKSETIMTKGRDGLAMEHSTHIQAHKHAQQRARIEGEHWVSVWRVGKAQTLYHYVRNPNSKSWILCYLVHSDDTETLQSKHSVPMKGLV